MVQTNIIVRFIVICTLALACGFLVGCEGETGPAGPAGEDAVASCVACHSDDTGIVARAGQWENSVHATGGTFERNSSSCAGCHTSEGFVARLATGTPGTPENPSAIGCFTCHAPHTEGDFSLRTEAPVTLEVSGEVFDYGEGNLCANCHMARTPDPEIAAAPATTSIESSHWGFHHGPQANMLKGKGAHEFAGTSYTSSYHTTGVENGCVDCHMATPFGAQAGGHQFGLTYDYHGSEEDLVTGCNVAGCHTSPELEDFNRTAYGDYDGDGNIEGVQDEIAGLLDKLRTELLNRGIIDDDDGVIAEEGNPAVLTEVEAGALANFLFVLEDRSMGIHNTDYAVALLQSSLDNLP